MNELKQRISDILSRLKKDKKALLTVIIGIAGMLLVLVSELPSFSENEQEVKGNETYFGDSLQEDTERLISKIQGAGRVSVMLTYDSGEETVWAKDSETQTQSDDKADVEEKHIIIDSQNGETGLAVKVLYPRVRGVAVVCTGGDDPVVKSEIKALLSALFDIGSNRISIARRAAEE